MLCGESFADREVKEWVFLSADVSSVFCKNRRIFLRPAASVFCLIINDYCWPVGVGSHASPQRHTASVLQLCRIICISILLLWCRFCLKNAVLPGDVFFSWLYVVKDPHSVDIQAFFMHSFFWNEPDCWFLTDQFCISVQRQPVWFTLISFDWMSNNFQMLD